MTFEGWSKRWDEYVSLARGEIAPAMTFTKGNRTDWTHQVPTVIFDRYFVNDLERTNQILRQTKAIIDSGIGLSINPVNSTSRTNNNHGILSNGHYNDDEEDDLDDLDMDGWDPRGEYKIGSNDASDSAELRQLRQGILLCELKATCNVPRLLALTFPDEQAKTPTVLLSCVDHIKQHLDFCITMFKQRYVVPIDDVFYRLVLWLLGAAPNMREFYLGLSPSLTIQSLSKQTLDHIPSAVNVYFARHGTDALRMYQDGPEDQVTSSSSQNVTSSTSSSQSSTSSTQASNEEKASSSSPLPSSSIPDCLLDMPDPSILPPTNPEDFKYAASCAIWEQSRVPLLVLQLVEYFGRSGGFAALLSKAKACTSIREFRSCLETVTTLYHSSLLNPDFVDEYIKSFDLVTLVPIKISQTPKAEALLLDGSYFVSLFKLLIEPMARYR